MREDTKTGKFRGEDFPSHTLPYVRRLALCEEIALYPSAYKQDRDALCWLASNGFAVEVEQANPKPTIARVTYMASDALRSIADRPVVSFYELARKMGMSLDRVAQRRALRKYSTTARYSHAYPKRIDVLQAARRLGVDTTDQYQFSSKGLTTWYVKQFCEKNGLLVEERV